MRAPECVAVLAIGLSGCDKSPSPPPALMSLSQAVLFHPEQISEIIAKGAAVDQLDGDGNTPLWRAVRFSKLESVRHMLAAGADPNTRGQMDWTPLHCATFCSSSDQDEIVELLLAYGADENAIEPRYGDTPLHYAVGVTSSSKVVKLLIASGAQVDATKHDGSTPLQSAVASGKPEIADILLKAGADPELRNKVGFRPIDQLNACEDPQAVQAVFRSNGADDSRSPNL